MGRKDIIKVDGGEDLIDINILGFIDTNITVNIIQDENISEKINSINGSINSSISKYFEMVS